MDPQSQSNKNKAIDLYLRTLVLIYFQDVDSYATYRFDGHDLGIHLFRLHIIRFSMISHICIRIRNKKISLEQDLQEYEQMACLQ